MDVQPVHDAFDDDLAICPAPVTVIRTSLKERAGVKRGFGLHFRAYEAICRAW